MSTETPALEKHYTVGEIAKLWQVSDDTVRNIFFDEPGVLKIGKASRLSGGRKKKLVRHWSLLRIPESVFVRVQNRLMHKRPAEGSAALAARIRGSAGGELHAAS
jgi:hypothetical protein